MRTSLLLWKPELYKVPSVPRKKGRMVIDLAQEPFFPSYLFPGSRVHGLMISLHGSPLAEM